MTKLLVSVRSLDEARIVDDLTDVLDIKEPQHGSLGAAAFDAIQQLVEAYSGRVPVSAAMGELTQFDTTTLKEIPAVDYLKFGLSECAGVANWEERWSAVREQIADRTRMVAVFYADQELAKCPSAVKILERAIALECSVFLVDTYVKSAGRLWDWMSVSELIELRQLVEDQGLEFALAGSIRGQDLPQVVDVAPGILAVRSAVCAGKREGHVSRERAEQFTQRWREQQGTFDRTT